jgi:hypothetical protein
MGLSSLIVRTFVPTRRLGQPVTMEDMSAMRNDEDVSEPDADPTVMPLRLAPPRAQGAMATLSHEDLLASQAETLHTARADDYARLDSVADLFRQISYDERIHKEESLAAMREPRFS